MKELREKLSEAQPNSVAWENEKQSLLNHVETLELRIRELESHLRNRSFYDDGRPTPARRSPNASCPQSIKDILYPNQLELGQEVAATFGNPDSNVSHVMVYSPTQSGKTGAAIGICTEVCEKIEHFVPENVFIITGVTMNEWLYQTQDRFESLSLVPPANILKLSDLTALNNSNGIFKGRDLKQQRNLLFIVDEFHIASASSDDPDSPKNQSLAKLMTTLGYFVPSRENGYDDKMFQFNCKMVHISATPEASWNTFLHNWPRDRLMLCKLNLNDSPYYSVKDLFNNGQVRQAGPLLFNYQAPDGHDIEKDVFFSDDYTVNRHLVELYSSIVSFDEPKYHVIRAPRRKTKKDSTTGEVIYDINYTRLLRDTLIPVFEQFGVPIDFLEKDSRAIRARAQSIVERDPAKYGSIPSHQLLLEFEKPRVHTFLVVKEDIKCAVTLPKRYLGVLHDRITSTCNFSLQLQYFNKIKDARSLKPQKHKFVMKRESFVAQSFLGRATGYGKPSVMKSIIVFTDIMLAKSYIRDTFDALSNPESFETYKRIGSCYVMTAKYFAIRKKDSLAASAPPIPFFDDLETASALHHGRHPDVSLGAAADAVDEDDAESIAADAAPASQEQEQSGWIPDSQDSIQDYVFVEHMNSLSLNGSIEDSFQFDEEEDDPDKTESEEEETEE